MMIKKYTTGEIDAPSVILIKNNNSRHNEKQKTTKNTCIYMNQKAKQRKFCYNKAFLR